jgi:hypothetical protein
MEGGKRQNVTLTPTKEAGLEFVIFHWVDGEGLA